MKIIWSLPVRGETFPNTRGDFVRAQQLSAALESAGHEVVMLCDAQRPGAALTIGAYRNVLRRILPRPVALIFRDLGRWQHGRRHGAWVAQKAQQFGAQLIIETQVAFSPSGALAATLTGLPLVLDDCSPSQEEEAFGVGLPQLARAIQRRQARAAEMVVAVSAAARQSLEKEGVPADRIRIVPNGVDSGLWRWASREKGRRQLGLNGSSVIGFVGSFQPWHRTEWLATALTELADQETRLVLVGDGPGRQATLDSARHFGVASRVHTTGSLEPQRLPDLVAAFDVGMMPGTNDYGQPMKLLEYAAAGVPCVAPDLRPIRDVVGDGVTGLLFPAEERAGLVRNTNRLLEDKALARDIGRAARRRVLDSASWQSLASGLLP